MEQLPCTVIVFVHNLSYEFSFLKGIYHFEMDQVSVIEGRKILRAKYRNIEYRCSYLQTNMNLDLLLKQYHVPNKKLTLDYSKRRFSDTPMDESEIAYCVNDVLGLTQALRARMKAYGDNLITIPLTSTGYARRECKAVLYPLSRTMKGLHGSFEVYKLLRRAFRGGNTHANKNYTGYPVDNVISVDRSSSYPDVLVNCRFPIRAFTQIKNPNIHLVLEDIQKDYAVLMDVTFLNLRLKNKNWGCPYISTDGVICDALTFNPITKSRYKFIKDNGRIVELTSKDIDDPARINMCITDIDLQIILSEYVTDGIIVNDAYISKYGYLPDSLRNLIIEYYRRKTALKGLDDDDSIQMYNKSKALLNSLYGMFSQDPAKIDWVYEEDDAFQEQFHRNEKMFDREHLHVIEAGQREAYEMYIQKSLFPYQWGVWVTALARLRLEEGIEIAGGSEFFRLHRYRFREICRQRSII